MQLAGVIYGLQGPFRVLPSIWKVVVVAFVAGTASFLLPAESRAATADVVAKGLVYCASTHPNHGTIGGFGPAVDINGKVDDYRWPVYAPGEGRVTILSSGGGFGNSIIWTSRNGRERIHIAHLDSFGHTGRVRAGEQIGRVGSTGHSTGSHLHMAASVAGGPAKLVLLRQRGPDRPGVWGGTRRCSELAAAIAWWAPPPKMCSSRKGAGTW
jgi:murein DD-endopeptidase MepM/ murein hydrolase activator NlpD